MLIKGTMLSGEAVVGSLQDRSFTLEGRIVAVPELMSTTTWERHQSGHRGTYQPLDWPVIETQLIMQSGAQREPQGPLLPIGEAPSFLNLYTAVKSFFWLGGEVMGGQMPRGAVYRHQDLRARIQHVRIVSDGSFVEVEVDGKGSDAMIVELPGDMPGPHKSIWFEETKGSQIVRFDLEAGLPPGMWILLRKGEMWIDRRFLFYPWSRGNEVGVEYEVDQVSRLQALVASRERQEVEFKQKVPEPGEGRSRLMKAVCCFANDSGGSVLVGVTDDRELVGVGPAEVGRLSDQLSQMVGTWIDPRPVVSFQELPIQDSPKVVLEMRVEPVTGAVCGSGGPGETKTIYVRHQGVSEKATPREITALIQSRTGGQSLSFSGLE